MVSPVLPVTGVQDIDPKQEVGHGVGLDGGEEVFGPQKQGCVHKAGDDAGYPAVVLQPKGNGHEDEGKPGEGPKWDSLEGRVDQKTQGKGPPEELLHHRDHEHGTEQSDAAQACCPVRAELVGIEARCFPKLGGDAFQTDPHGKDRNTGQDGRKIECETDFMLPAGHEDEQTGTHQCGFEGVDDLRPQLHPRPGYSEQGKEQKGGDVGQGFNNRVKVSVRLFHRRLACSAAKRWLRRLKRWVEKLNETEKTGANPYLRCK